MSIWEIGVQYLNNKEAENAQNEGDTTILFVGDKSSGKSTIINRFLDKNDNPKPTVALEYSFGRQTRGHNISKLICHVWELGGGTWLQKLIDIVITPDNIRNFTLAIVVDLAEPNSIFTTIDTFLNSSKARINLVLDKIIDDCKTKMQLTEKMEERLGNCVAGGDRQMMDPFLIPLVIIGGRYDKFRELDLKQRTIICRTLRFISHYYGGSLLFFSNQQETTVNKLRMLLRHLTFASSENKSTETSPKNPICVPFGQDSFVDIGLPEFNDGSPNQLPGEKLVQFWKRAYFSFYPPKSDQKSDIPDPGKNPQFAEPLVDEAKRLKDEELEKYRKVSDRRMRDLHQQAINEGMILV